MRVSHFFGQVLSDLLSCIVTPVLMFVSMRLLKHLRTHFIGVRSLYYMPSNLLDKYVNFLTSFQLLN